MTIFLAVPNEIHTSLLKFSSFWYNSDSILVFLYVTFLHPITKKKLKIEYFRINFSSKLDAVHYKALCHACIVDRMS